MTSRNRFVLSIIGALAVFTTGAFVWMTVLAPSATKASKADIGLAKIAAAGAKAGLEGVPEVVEAPATEAAPEAPLVFDHPGSTQVAEAALAKMPIYPSAAAATPSRTLNNPTREGMRLVLGVREVKGDWLRVQLPVRPNGTTGWVKKADVAMRSVPNHIVIEISKRKLTAWKGDTLLMESPAGVGTPKTPTPEGTYYVDVSARNPGHGLGVHMLSVSGFSNVLTNFAGGTGQIAIHGTSNMATVGAFSSNGCIRLPNETITKLARIAPTGTPVYILP
jgi:lipoprotein-anchoring transpeptidase ErfK/SrfK